MDDPQRLADLGAEQFVSLTTFKRDGTGVPTPMWVVRDGDHLAFWTPADSWKVKRARRDPRVTIVACSRRGKVEPDSQPVTATVTVSTDPAHLARIRDAVRDKYGWFFHVITTVERVLRRGREDRALVLATLD